MTLLEEFALKQTHTKAAKRSQVRYLVLALLLGGLLVGSVFLSTKKTPVPAVQQTVSPAPLGWKIVDYLQSRRAHYLRNIGVDGLPEWQEFTPAYFATLKARKDAVIAWASVQTPPPSIVFLGLVHVSMDGSTTKQELQNIETIQTKIFETLRVKAQHAQVVAIEESGSDAVVTPEVFVAISRTMIHRLLGRTFSDADILVMMHKDRQAATRAIMEGVGAPIICGEEWPIRMETRLLRRPADASRSILGLAKTELINSLNVLRSEIILIRTLEYLKMTRGSTGIILQGANHQFFLEHVADEYHVSVTSTPPP